MPKVNPMEVIKQVDKLPELPQVAMRLTQMLDNPNVSAEKLSEVIRVDPSLTSQLLRLCNSAAYGFRRTISTVKEAIAILGFKVLRSMVYTILAKAALDKPVPGYSLKEGDLWHNSLTCAVYAKYIAQTERFPDPELAFTAGLLRDIGKIILGEFVGPSYAEIEQVAIAKEMDFVSAEEEVIGISHTELGGRIAERWSLPPAIVSVIRYHHKPLKLPSNLDPTHAKLIGIVHLADVLTTMLGSGVGSDGMMYVLDIEGLQKLGINMNDAYMERLISQAVELNGTVKSLMDSFKSPTS